MTTKLEDKLGELVDGAYSIVEIFKTDSIAQHVWKVAWLVCAKTNLAEYRKQYMEDYLMGGGVLTDKQYEFTKPMLDAVKVLCSAFDNKYLIGVELMTKTIQLTPEAYLEYFDLSKSKLEPVGQYIRVSFDCGQAEFSALCTLKGWKEDKECV